MNASELKHRIESTGQNRHFFDRKTMKFFGDTMSNFAVDGPVTIYDWGGDPSQCWHLYRKRATRAGCAGAGYHFCASTFRRVTGPRYNVTLGYRLDRGTCSVIPTHSAVINVSAPNSVAVREIAMESLMASEKKAQHVHVAIVAEA
jgi:hypothetical protein